MSQRRGVTGTLEPLPATLLQIPLRKTFISEFNLCEQSVKKSTVLLIILVGKSSIETKLV